jgi:hypothetical protein
LDVRTSIQPLVQLNAERALADGFAEVLAAHPGVAGAQAAVVVVRASDGAIVAQVGGMDWERSSFDRATDAVREIGSVLKRLGVSRPMIVSDAFMASSGVLAKVTDAISKAGLSYGVFTDTVPDPTDHIVDKGLAALKEGSYDGLVAVGGGSPMDTAKAIAILEAGGGHMRDYKVPNLADNANLPIICVPTTAGTGSEATFVAILTDTAAGTKVGVVDPALLADAAPAHALDQALGGVAIHHVKRGRSKLRYT